MKNIFYKKNNVQVIKDSIDTSITMKLFTNRKEASYAHIFKSELVKIPMTKFKNVNNFNPNRLQKSAIKAYPPSDRPRGNKDISSVKYYQKLIKDKKDVTPIWMIKKNNEYILLDGAHRVVSNYIEGKRYINSYVINI